MKYAAPPLRLWFPHIIYPVFLQTGEIIRAPVAMAHTEMTSEPPRYVRPQFEASSLVNKIDGPSVSTLTWI